MLTTKSLAGKFKTGNKYIGYIFHKKQGTGYITFPTLAEAKKKGYKK